VTTGAQSNGRHCPRCATGDDVSRVDVDLRFIIESGWRSRVSQVNLRMNLYVIAHGVDSRPVAPIRVTNNVLICKHLVVRAHRRILR
jgi:hypothetical protein